MSDLAWIVVPVLTGIFLLIPRKYDPAIRFKKWLTGEEDE